MPDRYEDHDTAFTATDPRTVSGETVLTGLNMQANDPDRYRFSLGSAGRDGGSSRRAVIRCRVTAIDGICVPPNVRWPALDVEMTRHSVV